SERSLGPGQRQQPGQNHPGGGTRFLSHHAL
ncbi:uncharacterized protein METZ01_LOCUS434344, partial [marine metagenome]